MTGKPMQTPWGASQTIEQVVPGVVFVTTASHGGFYLDAERNKQVSIEWRRASFNQNGLRGWYEEDCDWCMVALTFPDAMPAQQFAARNTFDQWIAPKLAKAEAQS